MTFVITVFLILNTMILLITLITTHVPPFTSFLSASPQFGHPPHV